MNIRNKAKKIQAPKFSKGDTVRVVGGVWTEFIGQSTVISRVFWAPAGGGQPAGWVYTTDLKHDGSDRKRSFWEHLLATPVN